MRVWTGQLLVQYRGETIPTQEAPPRPGLLRASNGALPYGPDLERRVNGAANHHHGTLASFETDDIDFGATDGATRNGNGRVRKPTVSPRRNPTPRQKARWKTVQQAKLRGLSIRAIARELGIHRDTARKYAAATRPPMMRTRIRSRTRQPDDMAVA